MDWGDVCQLFFFYDVFLIYIYIYIYIYIFSDGFSPFTSCLWNSLPSSVFAASFKMQFCHHLRDQMAWCFFLLPFLDIV